MIAPSHDRHAARRRGLRAEQQAELLLRLKMFAVLARNYRVRDGEIDLIVRRGSLISFVEVKARPTVAEGIDAIGSRKQRRIARAARHWIATHPWAARYALRADGVFIVPFRFPRHIAGIFDLDVG